MQVDRRALSVQWQCFAAQVAAKSSSTIPHDIMATEIRIIFAKLNLIAKYANFNYLNH